MLRFLLAAIAVLLSMPAAAGVFSVTPLRIFMAPGDRAAAVTVTNEGDDAIVMQADIYRWQQNADGSDDLALTEDLILSPPIIKLAPRTRQVVRLAVLTRPPAGTQATYRMVVREVPEARPASDKQEIQIALAFSMPVFITPKGLPRKLDCKLSRDAADTVRVSCENLGRVYVQVREFDLLASDGSKIASRDSGGYLLPGTTRRFDIKRANGPIPAGPLRLRVAFDDASEQNYELSLPE